MRGAHQSRLAHLQRDLQRNKLMSRSVHREVVRSDPIPTPTNPDPDPVHDECAPEILMRFCCDVSLCDSPPLIGHLPRSLDARSVFTDAEAGEVRLAHVRIGLAVARAHRIAFAEDVAIERTLLARGGDIP
jgi:hypothetical protein